MPGREERVGRVKYSYGKDIDKYEVSVDLEALQELLKEEGMSDYGARRISVKIKGGKRNFINIRHLIKFNLTTMGSFNSRKREIKIYTGNLYRDLIHKGKLETFEEKLQRVLAHEAKHALDRKKGHFIFKSERRARRYAKWSSNDPRWANIITAQLKENA